MNRLQFGALGLSLLLPTAALGDFQYQETTQITGGSMMGIMKFASHFSKQARQSRSSISTRKRLLTSICKNILTRR
jgi:hypothetical protein